MKGTTNLFRRFLSIFSAKVLTTIIAIVSTPVIVRLLGPGGYGDYAVFLSIFTLYMIPISSAITEGVQKYIAENRERENWQERVIRFYTILATILVLLGMLVLIAAILLGIPTWAFGEEFTLYFTLLVGYIFISQFRALGYHIVLGFGLEHISESLNVIRKFGTVTIGIGFLLFGLGVSGMILGHILANVIVTAIALVVILRTVSVRKVFKRTSASFPRRELLSFNALNVVLVLLLMSLFHIDVIMLRFIVGDETTGFYKAALQLAEYLWVVPMALQLLLLHSSSTLWSENKVEEITDLASRVTRYTLLLVGLMAVGLAALAERVVPLYYGEPFTVSVLPLLLLLPGTIGFALARPLQAISQGAGEIRTLIIATGVGAGLNLVLNALLIPMFGMTGAAVATSTSYGLMFALYVWAAWQIGYNPLSDFRAIRVTTTIVVSLPVIVLMAMAIQNDILALLIVPVVGTIVYTGVAILTGAVDAEECALVLGKLPAIPGIDVDSRGP